MPIQIGRAIGPPCRSALAQRVLGRVDGGMRHLFRNGIPRPPRTSNAATAIHQGCDVAGPIGFRQTGIGRAP